MFYALFIFITLTELCSFLRFCFSSAPIRYDSNASASDSSEEGNESEDEAAKKKKAKKTKVVKEKKERKPRKEVANEIRTYIWYIYVEHIYEHIPKLHFSFQDKSKF